MKAIRTFKLLVLLAICIGFMGQHEVRAQPKTLVGGNGCGTGWNTWLVPDSIPVVYCRFESACNKHDVCYGKCEGKARDKSALECEYLRCREGGDLHGSITCETNVKLRDLIVEADGRRKKCDTGLYNNIRGDNRGNFACYAFAVVYRDAVKIWGKGSFFGVDPAGRVLNQPKAEYDAAIREFFRQGTSEQFKQLVSGPGGKPSVDLGQPIRFDPARGLVNINK